jgi:SAM-dependent methyltransferase
MNRVGIGFALRRPWVTRFTIGGRSYGGHFSFAGDARIQAFEREFPPAEVKSVLDLGSLEGGQTFELARRYERVTGIEVRTPNLRRARYVQGLLGAGNVDFLQRDLEDPSALDGLPSFDAVFCSGLLYHLPKPWELLERLPRVAPRLLLWTHYAEKPLVEAMPGMEGEYFTELRPRRNATSGVSPQSFWPTLPCLVGLVERAYGSARVEHDDPAHVQGPAVTLLAARA